MPAGMRSCAIEQAVSLRVSHFAGLSATIHTILKAPSVRTSYTLLPNALFVLLMSNAS